MPDFLIGALRAIIEMLGLCLIGQGVLFLLSGTRCTVNPVWQLFSLVTRAPRQLVAGMLPRGTGDRKISFATFLILFFLWTGLAFLRKLH
ncbi:hypothetical protein [Quatrionicoccus australiensis]|uniref:hypothetical protein n=1 Tax=Quatrionicoccus australiensis TaxID=138118 RepID=UPI001CF99877|nr:hypothetical protein [Quatrionicoccus australiensis]MCB4358210.1 hypothetical protein [Quatrionicoccus australiensis]